MPLSPWEVLESLFAVLTESYDYCLWTSNMPVSQKLAKLREGWSIKYQEWKGGKELESGVTEIYSISFWLEQIKTQFSGFKKE